MNETNNDHWVQQLRIHVPAFGYTPRQVHVSKFQHQHFISRKYDNTLASPCREADEALVATCPETGHGRFRGFHDFLEILEILNSKNYY